MRQSLRRQVQYDLATGVDLTRWVGTIGLTVAVGIVYFLSARLSLALLTKPEGVAVFSACRGSVRRGPDRSRVPNAMARRCRHDGCNHRGEPLWRPEFLERCSLRFMQRGGSRAHGMADWALLRFGFQAEQATKRAGTGGGSDHRHRCLRDRRGSGIQIVSQHDDADIDDLAALVRIGRTGE